MENMMIEYELQAVPGGYRIVKKGPNNYVPVFETFPSLDEEILDKIVESLEEAYELGYNNAWRDCCNKLGIVVDY